MASATAARAPEVQDFVARMSAEGERIVREVLPAKLQELDKLLAVRRSPLRATQLAR